VHTFAGGHVYLPEPAVAERTAVLICGLFIDHP
jgi:hypothetical protein